ncbi:MAG: TonB-dependent receptor plug domain-containing protein, partial [Bacteroidales bacterium]|nr:TonB-dependent receptor plug domain-containing protein [Bacteroidales bacterium]
MMKSKKAVIAFIALSLLSVVSYAQNMVTSKEQQGLEKSIRYDVSKFTDTRDRKLEDVMKKMPGISVESWGGNSGYTYNGMGVEKIYVNGLDILGDDNSPVNNMKPEDVEFIEIIENHVTEKVMKGLQYSNSAAINVILKESAHTGWTGAVKAGAGVKPWLYNTDF